MRKEVILAVIIGVLLGGVILYGINLANSSSKTNLDTTNTETSTNEEASPTPIKLQTNTLSIVIPQNNSVVTDPQVTLKGTATPNANLAIVTESDDIITTADSSGNYSSPINLISGENTITVTSVDSNLATSSASITVIRTASLPE